MQWSAEMADYQKRIFSKYCSTTTNNPDSQKYKGTTGNTFKMYEKRFSKILPKDKAARILDVGCGNGDFLLFLKSKGYANIYGIDVSGEQIKLAKARGLVNIYQIGFMEYLEKTTEQFSLISTLSILEHLPKNILFDAFDAINKALIPGGLLLGQVPNAKGPFGSFIRYADFTHETCFTPESIVQIAAATGLKPLYIRECGPIPYGFISAIRWLIWQFIRALYLLSRIAQAADFYYRIYTQDCMFVLQKKI
jgi:2-polyprenyl-3-methyl-5-hydroxy-6-metoxy-1,4-benzoquinol methylase